MADKPTPDVICNRPGLPALQARGARHSALLAAMRRGLSDANRPGLSDLRPEDGDFTLALLDAYAGVLDTLGFYRERLANEQYLRTATERESLRAHARLVGYELAPAKAASVDLAFTAEAAGAPEEVMTFAAGLQVRSVPGDSQVPQIFETTGPLRARPDWNAMRPRLGYPQVLTAGTTQVQIAQGSPVPELGAGVILMQAGQPLPDGGTSGSFLRRVTAVADGVGGRKVVNLAAQPTPPSPYMFLPADMVMTWAPPAQVSTPSLTPLLQTASWSALALTSILPGFSLAAANAAVSAASTLPAPPSGPVTPHRLRARTGFFGGTAVTGYVTATLDTNGNAVAKPYSRSGPGALDATAAAVGQTAPSGSGYLYLDREETAITAGQILLIRGPGAEGWFTVNAAESTAVEAWGLSARVTRVQVTTPGTSATGGTIAMSAFSTRTAQAFAVPEALTLSDLPITAPVGTAAAGLTDAMVELDRADLGLIPGQRVALTGARDDLRGVKAACLLEIAENRVQGGVSVLTFTHPPPYPLIRDTVRMNANLAPATHGETVSEILGDGDAARPFQSFVLKSKPLTFVSAPGPKGMAPALEVRVLNVLWTLVDDFRTAGPADRVYVLRLAEDGSARVLFGDGITGARLPTAPGAVVARYRRGAGAAGLLEAGQLSLLAGKPAGIKAVTNPLPPAGASDTETLEDARRNAPLTVLTLGRVVTLRDYEDFARAFAGIAKARADAVTDGTVRRVHLTVAGTGGVILPETGPDMANLRAALQAAGEASLGFSVRNYTPRWFAVSAAVYLDPAHDGANVVAQCKLALGAAFSFDARALGQGVSAAQVIATLQGVAGVRGVDLNLLHYVGARATLSPRLPAAVAQPGESSASILPAELLRLDDAALVVEIA
jgi:predicted phage baseplate assembly protein